MKTHLSVARPSALSRLYGEAGLPAGIQRSLNFMLMGNLFGNLFGIICGAGTTAMIGLANELHAGDLAFGLISGIPQAAMLLQIPFAMLVSRTHMRKRYLLTYGLFSRFLWTLFGLIPSFVPGTPSWLRLGALIGMLAVSSCCSAALNVCWLPWVSDLAPAHIRGRWFSFRDTIIAGCNLAFGLLVARLLDTMPRGSRYAIIFLIGGVLGMLDMICFGFCEETPMAQPAQTHLKNVLGDVFKNKPFMRLVWMWTAWCFTANLCEPYLGRYSINEMHLNFTQMMLFGTAAASVMTIVMMRRWGRALDRFGSRSVMMVATLGAALANVFYLFSTPGSVWPVMLRNALGAAFWCGSNLAANNMQLYTSPDESRPMYIALFSCTASLVGTALGSLTGGTLLELWDGAGWFAGGFDRYKALIALATVLRVGSALALVPPLQNDREGTPGMLVRSVLQAFHLHRR